ncbi:MAG: xanthine phosphoribosyltransferase [Oscillospiraceae bacterium]|nr:xanthine phosphoribosyltransferase [Oscillospiraceae bacterium]
MEQLKKRIVEEGRILPGGIVKVDGFLNHRIDTSLMDAMADEFAKYFDTKNITMILTAEASGIALATICAQRYNVPMVFAKKAKSDNIEGGLYHSEIFSYTYKKKVTQLISKEWISSDDKILVVDDFMANGEAMRSLCDIVSASGATLVGIGCAVEKGFQGGGDRLRQSGVNLKSLAIIESAEPGNIIFREDA